MVVLAFKWLRTSHIVLFFFTIQMLLGNNSERLLASLGFHSAYQFFKMVLVRIPVQEYGHGVQNSGISICILMFPGYLRSGKKSIIYLILKTLICWVGDGPKYMDTKGPLFRIANRSYTGSTLVHSLAVKLQGKNELAQISNSGIHARSAPIQQGIFHETSYESNCVKQM